MVKYRAIEQPLKIKSSLSDLIALAWRDRGIIADFVIPSDDEHALRVRFDKTHIVRILDEMPLSTESEDAKSEGLVSDHFAYFVEQSLFWEIAIRSIQDGMRQGPSLSLYNGLDLSRCDLR